jgi:alginate O-acetyltransferase complex protein AlgJ
MAPRDQAALAAVVLLAISACHAGLGQTPWPAAAAQAASDRADVKTLNEGYARTRSSVLVRQVGRPTRAALDWAAYHANFMIADPAPETPLSPFVVNASAPFGGLIDKETLTGDVGGTRLTDDERANAFAFAPATEYLAAKKIAGAEALGDVASAVRGETWGRPGGPGLPTQVPTDLFVHDTSSGPELWLKIELAPWFASTALRGASDQDGDGVPEVYGRIKAGLVASEAAAALRGDYAKRVLTPAEVKAWANQLSSYWYPSFNTDLVPAGAAWPDTHTEPDIKQELGGRTFSSPTFVLRGKPAGRAVYQVFMVASSTADVAANPASAGSSALALPSSRPSPAPGVVTSTVERELAAHGGSWDAWQQEVAALHAALRRRLAAMPEGSKALAGDGGFLFFRNGLEYVVGGDLAKQPPGKNPLPVIREFQRMLADHGVDFLFVPVPTKEEIFPDAVDPAGRARVGQVVNPYGRKLLLDLAREGIETIDLLPAFLAARSRDEHRGEEPLYQRQDTHWTDRGLRLAADLIAARVKSYPWYAGLTKHARKLRTRPATFTRFGDLHSRLPEVEKARYRPESLHAQQVLDAGKLYEDDADSPVTVLGDSFTGVYELTDAEHAGVSAHLARGIGYPVDLVMSYGGGPNVRQKLMRRGVEGLAGKKLVIWMMTARDLYNYWEDWTPLKVK